MKEDFPVVKIIKYLLETDKVIQTPLPSQTKILLFT